MGCKCQKTPVPIEILEGKVDLPTINHANIKDSLEKYEKQFPLYRQHVSAWVFKMQQMGKD